MFESVTNTPVEFAERHPVLSIVLGVSIVSLIGVLHMVFGGHIPKLW